MRERERDREREREGERERERERQRERERGGERGEERAWAIKEDKEKKEETKCKIEFLMQTFHHINFNDAMTCSLAHLYTQI